MARQRIIKPEFFTNGELWRAGQAAGLNPCDVQIAYAALWTASDREGRFKWRPDELKLQALPFWSGDFGQVLDALDSGGFVERYTVNGKEYGRIPTLLEHQKPHHREGPSRIPAPEPESPIKARPSLNETRPSPIQSRPSPTLDPFLSGVESVKDPVHGGQESVKGCGKVGSAPFQNREDALRLDIRERSQRLLDNPHTETFVEPNKWPEVLDLAKAFSVVMDWHVPRFPRSDPTVVKMVTLFAAFSEDELDRAVKAAPTDEFLKKGRKGLGCLTTEVVGRLLNPKRSEHRDGEGPVQPSHGETFEQMQARSAKAKKLNLVTPEMLEKLKL